MSIFEIIYAIAAVIAMCAGVPQLRRLIVAKQSEELSLATWVTWMLTQCATLMYVISIGHILMAFVSFIWISFYAAMIFLILYYRRRSELNMAADNGLIASRTI